MVNNRLLKGMVSLGIGIVFVAGLVTTSYGADKITVRMVAAWAKAAQFETQQFLSFIEMIQKEADQKYPGQIVFEYKGAGEVIPTQQQLEALRSGLVDMIMTAASYCTAVMPELDVMSLTSHDPDRGEKGRGERLPGQAASTPRPMPISWPAWARESSFKSSWRNRFRRSTTSRA